MREIPFSDVVGKKHPKEFIICSAVHILDGVYYNSQPKNIDLGFVVSGRRHSDCYTTLSILGYNLSKDEHIHGFITNENRFVDRYEGLEIAKQANQIYNSDDKILISESLY
jgi:hypothetical protein